MDQEQYDLAMESFYEATLCWNENYMALLNMANIEREHRSIEKAIGHYNRIIKLSEKQNAGGLMICRNKLMMHGKQPGLLARTKVCTAGLLYVSFVSSPSWKML